MYLTREPKGSCFSRRTFLKKGAGANGHLQRFIRICDYAMRSYNSCYTYNQA